MTLQDQVTSLKLSKKLKELGVKQESLFYWVESGQKYGDGYGSFAEDLTKEMVIGNVESGRLGKIRIGNVGFAVLRVGEYENDNYLEYPVSCCAFTASELGEMLGKGLRESHKTPYENWTCTYIDPFLRRKKIRKEGDTEANARAKMLIYLLENKLITL